MSKIVEEFNIESFYDENCEINFLKFIDIHFDKVDAELKKIKYKFKMIHVDRDPDWDRYFTTKLHKFKPEYLRAVTAFVYHGITGLIKVTTNYLIENIEED